MDGLGARAGTWRYRGLRRAAVRALQPYGIECERLVLLGHAENVTFRADDRSGARFVVRMHRVTGSPLHPPRSLVEVESELAWLASIRRDTDLAVPEPVTATDGRFVTSVDLAGETERRMCVVFRWRRGRFLDAGLRPTHLGRVGRFMARLHDHAVAFSPPAGFARWRIGDLSEDIRAFVADEVRTHGGEGAVGIVDEVARRVMDARDELGTGPDAYGLIHADLHQENYMFRGDRVAAIDFDDCGWGHHLHDLSVTLSEIRGRPEYEELRTALLRGYRTVRELPTGHERFLETFEALRTLQLTLWALEQRDTVPTWRDEFDSGIADLEEFVRRAERTEKA